MRPYFKERACMGMASPGVENVGGPRGSILELSRASQLPYNQNIKNKYQKLSERLLAQSALPGYTILTSETFLLYALLPNWFKILSSLSLAT